MAAQVGSQRELGPAHLAQPWPAAAPGAAIETPGVSVSRRPPSVRGFGVGVPVPVLVQQFVNFERWMIVNMADHVR
jgi:hypothetical protein